MNPNAEIIERFYSCFQKLDGDGMAQCYHENIVFSDPVFPELRGKQAGAMWKMLCSQAREFELTFGDIQADATNGSAHWEAKYLFSTTGRKVHNKINASFRFQDGKIIQHHDRFHFWTWSFMALGTVGLLLGWSPLIKNNVRKQAAKNLEKFISKQKM
ncbi:MAG: nuclear transport factor 2 family protein [Pseudomonadota bacterium]